MDVEAYMEYLPSNSDDQFRIGIQILQKSFRDKVDSLSSELEQVKQFAKERQNEVADMKNTLNSIQFDLQKKETVIKQLNDDKTNLQNEKNHLLLQIKKLNRELAKLNSFRNTIIKSINQDNFTGEGFSSIDSSLFDSSPLQSSPFIPKQKQKNPRDHGLQEELHDDDDDDVRDLSSLSLKKTPSKNLSFGTKEEQKHSPLIGSPSKTTAESYLAGKEFFRKAKMKLPPKQFHQFLECIKRFNSKQQSKQETLKNVKRILGDNQDLYESFQYLLSQYN